MVGRRDSALSKGQEARGQMPSRRETKSERFSVGSRVRQGRWDEVTSDGRSSSFFFIFLKSPLSLFLSVDNYLAPIIRSRFSPFPSTIQILQPPPFTCIAAAESDIHTTDISRNSVQFPLNVTLRGITVCSRFREEKCPRFYAEYAVAPLILSLAA